MSVENIRKHLSFMRDLDHAIDEALVNYKDADDSDLDELRHMKREVQQARRSIFIYVEKRRLAEGSEIKKLDKAFNKNIDKGISSSLLKSETALPA